MSDNVAVTAGSGTVIAADEVTRNAIVEKQQVIKISLGAEGAFDNLVDSGQQLAAASIPVVLASDTSLPAGTNAIGKLAANSGVDIGDVDVTTVVLPTGAGTVGTGRKTVTTAGTRVQLDAQACKYVVIIAETDNTDIVVLGGSGVVAALATRQGIPLFAAQSIRIEVSNMNLLYIDALVDTEGITFAYFN